MDNTLKMVIGVLGLSGLLVLFVPSSVPPTAPAEAPAPAVAPAPPAPATDEAAAEPEEEADTAGDEDLPDIGSFGDPMMSADPVDAPNGDSDNASGQNRPNSDNVPPLPSGPPPGVTVASAAPPASNSQTLPPPAPFVNPNPAR